MASHGEEFESPVDLGEGKGGGDAHPLRWTSISVVVASAVLALTNAVAIEAWVQEQPPGPLQAQAADLAGRWSAFTADIGIGIPRAFLHMAWKDAQATRFDQQEPDAQR